MTEKSMFFGGDPAPEYNQTEVAEYFKSFFSDGVFFGVLNSLEVEAHDPPDMSVNIKTGKAWIQGYWYMNDTLMNKAIDAADATNPRIDRVVLKLDAATALNISCYVKKGTPAVSPSPPELEQSGSIWEISLAQIYVGAGVTSITQDKITDERTLVNIQPNSSIDEVDIKDGAITTNKIADSAVTTSKIASSAVTESKIATGAITTSKISDNQISDAKIASHTTTKITVPTSKLSGTIVTAQIDDNSVTDAKIASHTTTKITVPTSKLSGTISTAQIASGAVTSDKLGSGTFKRLKRTVVSSNTSWVEWTDLSISYTTIAKLFFKVPNPQTTSGLLKIYINEDTTDSHYYRQVLKADGTTVAANRNNYPEIADLQANTWVFGEYFISCGTGGYVIMNGQVNIKNTSNIQTSIYSICSTFACDSITAIGFGVTVANSIGDGAIFELYISVV